MARLQRIAALLVAVAALVLWASALTGCGDSSGTSYPVFTRDNWGELAADPDSFEGARVDIVGAVLGEPVKNGDVTRFQMWPHPTNVDWFAVVEFKDASFTIADGGYVHVLGTVRGKTKGSIPLLAIVDAVAVRAETAEVVDESAAAPPALRTVEVGKSIEQHQLVVTLDRVEFAANETRVYVTVSNRSAATASFWGYKTKAAQGQTEYQPEDLSPYPSVGFTNPPGVASSGVVLFKAMDPALATELSFDARTDNYQLEFGPFVFVIAKI